MVKVTAPLDRDVTLCPVRQVLARMTGKWQMLIFLELAVEARRFGALKRSIGDITQRVLTENLRTLERDGHLTRTVDPGPPVSVTYALTPQGQEAAALLRKMVDWAAATHPAVVAARDAFDGR